MSSNEVAKVNEKRRIRQKKYCDANKALSQTIKTYLDKIKRKSLT